MEKEIREKTALGLKVKKEVDDLEKAASKTRLSWQKLIEETGRYKSVANKYTVLSNQLEDLEEGSKQYKELERRIKSFEGKYKKWVELVEETEKKKDEYHALQAEYNEAKDNAAKKYNVGKLTLLQYVSITLEAKLKSLKKEKELLSGARAVNMEKHRDELANEFSNPKAQRSISGMIVNSIDEVLQGQLYSDEFSEDELLQFLEETFREVSMDKIDRFNFLRTLAEDSRNYKRIEVGGKIVKVFDMDEISPDDMMRVFSGWFRESILMTVLNVLKKMKNKKRLFVRETTTRNNDGEEVSLYDSVVPDDSGISVLDEGSRRKRRELTEDNIVDQNTKDIWKGAEAYLNMNTDKIADMVNQSLQNQLPENAYYIKIGEQKAGKELRSVIKKLIRSCGNEIRNGSFMASTKLRNFVKTAIGGVESSDIFNIIYTVIRAALEYYIVSFLYKDILGDVKEARRDETSWEVQFLNSLEKRKDISKQALHNYRMVKYASKTLNIASRIADDYDETIESFLDDEEDWVI